MLSCAFAAKNAVPSSKGLRDCLKSIEDRFPWGIIKYWFTISMSFIIQVIVGPGFYGLDVYTDIRFTSDMFSLARRNFTQDVNACRPDFETNIDHVIDYCKTNLTQEVCSYLQDHFYLACLIFHPFHLQVTCLQSLSTARKIGKKCFENQERFDDPFDWKIAGTVCALHSAFPIIFSFILWEILKIGKNCVSRGLKSIFRLPLPIVAKFNKFLCLRQMYNNFADKNRYEDQDTEREFEERKEKFQKKLDKIEDIVNLSLILEASLEASFQFFFQTVYIMPSVVVALTALSTSRTFAWEDLFNRRITSILLSFLTVSWAFYAIR